MAQIAELGPTQAKRIESSFPPGITPPVVRIEPNTSTRPQHQRRIRVPVSLGTLSDSPLNDRPSCTDHRNGLNRPAYPGGLVVTRLDRKSTRLNSSHVAISYAVFCLKKKIQRVTHHRVK